MCGGSVKTLKTTRIVELDGKQVYVTAFRTSENLRTCKQCSKDKAFMEFPYGPNTNGKLYLYSLCRECRSLSSRNWNLANLDKHQENKFRYNLKFYGLTPEKYREMLEEQGGVCKICGQPPCQGRTLLSVDHDHSCCPKGGSCGECVRGLLCEECNKAIGIMRDSPERLRKAADYLEHYTP